MVVVDDDRGGDVLLLPLLPNRRAQSWCLSQMVNSHPRSPLLVGGGVGWVGGKKSRLGRVEGGVGWGRGD